LSVLGDWSAEPGSSLHRRLATAIADAIEAGLVPPGSVLPAERTLASALAVGRSTVTAALSDLKAAGLVEARQGSGTRVVGPVVGPGAGSETGAVVLPGLLAGGSAIDLAAAVAPDARWLPPTGIDLADLLGHPPRHGYSPEGLPALRAALADRFATRGVPTTPEQILVTNGAHHGLSLALRHLCRPGESLVVDDPAYPGLVDLVAAVGIRPVPVARRAGGVDAAALSRAVAASGATVACLQPLVHNPIGSAAEEWEIRRLASLCDQVGLVVIEDLVLEDLRFAGPGPVSLAGRVADGTQVVTVGSLSKSCWGGLRVGWLRAEAGMIRRLGRHRLPDDLGTSVPSQVLALALLGREDEVASARREVLASRCQLLGGLLADHLPAWRVTPVAGGLSAWVTLPIPVAGPLAQAAARLGVAVATGASASFGDGTGCADRLRLCFDRPEPQLRAAVHRLVPAWQMVAHRSLPG
jgi:DNA-binding transcriptional MocR family regulator